MLTGISDLKFPLVHSVAFLCKAQIAMVGLGAIAVRFGRSYDSSKVSTFIVPKGNVFALVYLPMNASLRLEYLGRPFHYPDNLQSLGRQKVRLSVPNRRGDPTWTRSLPVVVTPAGASTFEHLVAMLGLAPGEYEDSTALREWARKNKNDRYVPSELLQAWKFTVDTGPEPRLGHQHNRIRPHRALD